MKMKMGALVLLAMGISSLYAQDNAKGIDFYKAGMYADAKETLLQNLNDGKTNKAEAYYYLGETYAAQNKKDSAAYYYGLGTAANPAYVFNAIGSLKLDLKNNPNADKAFEGFITGKNKKNPAVYVAIARAYMPVSMDKANEYLAKAKAVGPKAADVYILEGDMLQAQHKVGEAAGMYEQATYFDPNNKEAYFKYAKLYTRSNPQMSIDMLNKLITQDPEYKIVYSELADVYYRNERYSEAVDAYSKYINTETSNLTDLARYATLLYLGNNQAEAEKVVNEVTKRDPNSMLLRRLNMYINYDKGDVDKSYELAEYLKHNFDTTLLVPRDYIYFAKIAADKGKLDEAIAAYRSVVERDTSRHDIMKALYETCDRAGKYDDAIAAFQIYKDHTPRLATSDYFSLGKTYYMAGADFRDKLKEGQSLTQADSMKMAQYLNVADTLFKYIEEKVPDDYRGYFFRARGKSILDDQNAPHGMAAPHYEASLKVLEADPQKYKNQLMEAYRYFAVLNIQKDDYPTSLKYWHKILELDPQNADALRLVDMLQKHLKK